MANVLGFTVKDIDGKDVPLSTLKGHVSLVVNVASECGFTPQYQELEALWRDYKGKGLEILGFPSNDFGAQEPGTEAEIKQFCATKYHVTFPLFSKVTVKGPEKHPLYAALAETGGEPRWNFHKYLVGKDGNVIRSYKSRVEPRSKELLADIDAALAQ
jgi:glutathione peroxidase